MNDLESQINPIDADIGGDADIDGIAQTLTSEDVQTLLLSHASVAERVEALQTMKADLMTRDSVDRGGDMAALMDEIDHALATLRSG